METDVREDLLRCLEQATSRAYPAAGERPAVAEAAVVGVPDERWGEVCVAFVAVREEAGEEELLEFWRARLARYKVPRAIRFVDALPRNAMNKVAKSDLLVHVP